jgi:hypothetical protein
MRVRASIAVVASILLLGCVSGQPPAADPAEGYPTDERPMDSIALIDRDMHTGQLDYSTGMLFKVYALYEPLSLPSEYRSDVAPTAGSSVVSEVQRNWPRLTSEHQAEIESYIEPPTGLDGSDTELDDVTPDRLDHERNRLD